MCVDYSKAAYPIKASLICNQNVTDMRDWSAYAAKVAAGSRPILTGVLLVYSSRASVASGARGLKGSWT